MLSRKLLDEMNLQIKEELASAYIYLSMAAHFESQNLPGFATWMHKQAGEEYEHAMKFFEYINDRGNKVILQALEQPQVEFGNPTDVFEITLKHEQHITARINHLYKIALEENDYAAQGFLNWFISEQVEEEKTASEILETLKMVGEKGHAIIMLDRQLAAR